MPPIVEIPGFEVVKFDPKLLVDLNDKKHERPVRVNRQLCGEVSDFCTDEITIKIDGREKPLQFIHKWEDAPRPMRQYVFVYEDRLIPPLKTEVVYHVLCVEFVQLVSTGPTSVSIRYKVAKSNKDDFEPHVDVTFTGMENNCDYDNPLQNEWLNDKIRIDKIKELAAFCDRFC